MDHGRLSGLVKAKDGFLLVITYWLFAWQLLVSELPLQLHFHLMAHKINFWWVDIWMYILSLWNCRFCFDMLVRKVVGHSCLAMRHIDLKGGVSSLSVQFYFNFFGDEEVTLAVLFFYRRISSFVLFWVIILVRLSSNEFVMVTSRLWDIMTNVFVLHMGAFNSTSEHACFQVRHLRLIARWYSWFCEGLVSDLHVIIVLILCLLIRGLVVEHLLVRLTWVKHFVLAHGCWWIFHLSLIQLLLLRLELRGLLRADHWHIMLITSDLRTINIVNVSVVLVKYGFWFGAACLDCLTGLGTDGLRVEQARLPLVRVEFCGLLNRLVFSNRVRSVKRGSDFTTPHDPLLSGRIVQLILWQLHYRVIDRLLLASIVDLWCLQ